MTLGENLSAITLKTSNKFDIFVDEEKRKVRGIVSIGKPMNDSKFHTKS